MLKILLLIWQFPQSIGAFFVKLYLKKRGCRLHKHTYRGRTVYQWDGHPCFGVSLGEYIFVWRYTEPSLSHEYGHSRQSRYLGPLYLLTVGIVSAFWNLLARVSKRVNKTYYARWPENWADKLGGVRREEGI
jgi:hypothetical protein